MNPSSVVRRLAAVLALNLALISPLMAADRPTGLPSRGGDVTDVATTMLRDIDQSTWIRDGQSRSVMYVFFDPNCPYCRRVYEGLRAQVEFGEIELRWVPVGILMATSLGKAAALLEAKDPVAAFHMNENRFTTERGGFGGIDEEPLPKAETLEKLERNLSLLRRSGRTAVPSLLFRDRDGQPRFLRGAPPPHVLEQIVQQLASAR